MYVYFLGNYLKNINVKNDVSLVQDSILLRKSKRLNFVEKSVIIKE